MKIHILAKTLIASTLLLNVMATPILAETNGFTDIKGSYAEQAIKNLKDKGILSGLSDGSFNPQGELTRAEFMIVVVKALGLKVEPSATTHFTDVPDWASSYIDVAFKAGIISGINDTQFDANGTITREAMASILVRALVFQGVIPKDEVATLDFKDADSISDWAKPFVALAQKYKLMSGSPDGSFHPSGKATREMVAVVGDNLLKQVESYVAPETKSTPSPTPTPKPTPTPVPTPVPPSGGDSGGSSGGGSTGGGGETTPPTTNVAVTGVSLDKEHLELSVNGKTETLVATINPSNATNKNVTWSSSDESVATVLNGVVTPVKFGFAEITATTVDGNKAATTSVTVLREALKIHNVSIVSTNENRNVAEVGDHVIIVFVTDEQVEMNESFKINGKTPTYFSSSPHPTLKGKWNANADLLITESEKEGLVQFQLSIKGKDSGLYSQLITKVTDKTFVKVVGTRPNPITPQDFGYFADQNAYIVGFKIDLDTLPYKDIKKIEVTLYDGEDILTRRTAFRGVPLLNGDIVDQIANLQSDDILHGGEDGQLSVAFKKRTGGYLIDEYWCSVLYYFEKPTKAVITITDVNGLIYEASNENLIGSAPEIPIDPELIVGPEAEEYVQIQDFDYWAEQNTYNVGFKINIDNLPYKNIDMIEVFLMNGAQVLARNCAYDEQIGKLKDIDIEYSNDQQPDGQLSTPFYTTSYNSDLWLSEIFIPSVVPTKAVIRIKDNLNRIYEVEINKPTGVPTP
ncbi:hypothetical protein E0485_14505 [Paenibacillus albiflavus]|uniref:SLH domain-containing protein n=1 Tax=Paenibacillus albiflavus TaxID=2545760 RepID=A0A4R4EB95_9BACL|nr:S-layer homology domain-containing protein [Paenibacillus albiflavus]TCZ76403.1 hypothetical protein E0485_14505 [Paenibacillus albiflavus]